jgi:hypothetical protein
MKARLCLLQAKLAFSSCHHIVHQQFRVPGVSGLLATPVLALSSHASISQAAACSTAFDQGHSRQLSNCSRAVLPGLSTDTHGVSLNRWCSRPGHQLLHHSLYTTSSSCYDATAGSKEAAGSSAGPGKSSPAHASTPSSASSTSTDSSANSSDASSRGGAGSKLEVPPAVAAGAAAAGEAAAKAARAAAKQVRWAAGLRAELLL